MKCRKIKNRKGQKGQTIVESVACMLLICLILFGLLQIFHLVVAQTIFDYAAFTKARSAAVGMWGTDSTGQYDTEDGYLLRRATRVAAIPASGDLGLRYEEEFVPGGNPMSQFGWEQYRIPQYIRGQRWLNYEYWEHIDGTDVDYDGEMVKARVGCDYPVELPMKSAFLNNDYLQIYGEASIMNYSQNYLEE